MKQTLAPLLCLAVLTPIPGGAQTVKRTPMATQPKSAVVRTVQKHPTATGVAAGIAARAALKHSAAKKKMTGRRLSWAERHPTLSGIAAGLATRAAVKKSTPK